MRTSGHGNDALMILVPAGVTVVVAVMLFGGPAEALHAVNDFMRDAARVVLETVNGLL